MKCDYKNCSKKAKWYVTCIMGMQPRYVFLKLCNKHKNTPITIVEMEKK